MLAPRIVTHLRKLWPYKACWARSRGWVLFAVYCTRFLWDPSHWK